MSASSKKKLRKEQNAAKLTEKQRKEQVEAKKLKISSAIFVVVMVVVLTSALVLLAVSGIRNSGIIEKSTTALTVGEHKLNTVQMNYYYTDIVNSTYREWSSAYGDNTAMYLSMMGLDVTAPLNEQSYYGEESTWGDYFLDQAINQAKADYALYDMAIADGYTLTSGDSAAVDANISSMEMYASFSGYELDDYLRLFYGNGAQEKSLRAYLEVSAVAAQYYSDHEDSLSYDDAAIRAYEADKYQNYTSYDYSSYYLSRSNFLSEESAADPTDAELETAIAEAKTAAESLLGATNEEELNTAISQLAVNSENAAATATKYENQLYPNILSAIQGWVADETRQAGDIEVLPYESTTTDEDGVETTDLLGYYVVMYHGSNDNTHPMGNVRHLLVEFEGGTTDDAGNTTYSDAEKAAAKEEAEGYLATWKNGEATEESFIELVKEYSDDSSAADGGLFEDIHPESQYVENFLNWSIDENRQAGDAEVIETEYGYHVMYYVGDDELSYRDYLIVEELRAADMESWYTDLIDAVVYTEGNLRKVRTDMTITNS